MKRSYVTVTDMFCGCGGSSQGAVAASAEVVMAANHWRLAIETHNTNFPNTNHDCADISQVVPSRWPTTDVLWASPECFPAGTLILAERGLLPIEDVGAGDRVLTHRGRWMPVTKTMKTRKDTVVVRGQGNGSLETTSEHPFYAREQMHQWDNKKRDYNRRIYGNPEWVTAADLTDRKLRWATPIKAAPLSIPDVPGRGFEFSYDFWWMVGRWLGDGSLRIRETNSELTICCGKHEAQTLRDHLERFSPEHGGRAQKSELRWRGREIRTGYLFESAHSGLCTWLLEHFGEHADRKTIPTWTLTMPQEWRTALVEGYLSADGHKNERRTRVDSVSKRLALGIRLLAESLGYRALFSVYTHVGGQIEGREFAPYDMWAVAWENNKSQRAAFEDDLHAWSLVKSIKPGRQSVEVYNLSVAEDESYVADGIVVHNCTNHSLARGRSRPRAQVGMFESDPEDPSAVRSRATMWDVPRFAEYHDYNLVIVENVVEVRKWRLWDAWLHAMRSLDYRHQICYFNSQFFGVPQSRDRFYAVFWKKHLPAPDLEFRPRAYCPQCAAEVEAVQSWKKPAQAWGRYGDHGQYVYRCSRCASSVEPYTTPALIAIDWSDAGTRIGDRVRPLKPKTLRRIQRGLEEYGSRYLVVETAYGSETRGRACPVDGPMPTQTTRQTLALMVPWLTSVNYFRPNSPVDQPAPTQTTGNQHALTIPPSAIVVLRRGADAQSPGEPLTTITAGAVNHGLLRMPFLAVNYSPGYCRPVTDVLSSITTVDHHGVVMPEPFLLSYYSRDSAVHAVDEPMGTLSTLDRHALVQAEPFLLSYYSRDNASDPVDGPMGTITTEPRHALVQPENPSVEDCYFRMLKPEEIKLGMAFRPDYVVLGNGREQVRQCGNAVTPPVAEFLFARCMEIFK